ncbi:MAG TPA: hypothetical protein PK871_01195 [Mycobacterium sp.]|nr:hypothetical protein [Mycobacterium sp.]
MEAAMQSVTEPATEVAAPVPQWAVEVNFVGCRIVRWAEKRRHLLGIGRQSGAR